MDAAKKISEKIRTINLDTHADLQIYKDVKEYIENTELEKARVLLEKSLNTEDLPNAQLFSQLGVVYIMLDQLEKAEKNLLQSIEIDNECIEGYYNLGLLCQYKNDYPRALLFYKKVILLNDKDSEAFELLGDCCLALENYTDAIAFYDNSLRINPQSLSCAVNLAQLYLQNNNSDDAIKVLKIALVTHTNQKELHFALGDIYKNRNEYEHAIGHFRKVILLDENNSRAFYELGFCCYELGLTNQSIPLLAKAYKIDPHFSEPLYYLGKAYEKKKKIDSAVSVFVKWLDMESDNLELKPEQFISNYNEICEFLVNYYKNTNEKDTEKFFKDLIYINN